MRRQALAPLRALLLDAPPEARSSVDEDFACTALERLTAEEGAALCDWAAVSSASRFSSNSWCAVRGTPASAECTGGDGACSPPPAEMLQYNIVCNVWMVHVHGVVMSAVHVPSAQGRAGGAAAGGAVAAVGRLNMTPRYAAWYLVSVSQSLEYVQGHASCAAAGGASAAAGRNMTPQHVSWESVSVINTSLESVQGHAGGAAAGGAGAAGGRLQRPQAQPHPLRPLRVPAPPPPGVRMDWQTVNIPHVWGALGSHKALWSCQSGHLVDSHTWQSNVPLAVCQMPSAPTA